MSSPQQQVTVSLEFSLPMNLTAVRDGPLLRAPLDFVAPLALGCLLIARAFAATSLPAGPAPRRRRRDSVERPQWGASGRMPPPPTLTALLEQLNVRRPGCQQLVVCEMHRLIAGLPAPLVAEYASVSRYLPGVDRFASHVIAGLERRPCEELSTCPRTPTELLLNTGLLQHKRR